MGWRTEGKCRWLLNGGKVGWRRGERVCDRRVGEARRRTVIKRVERRFGERVCEKNIER